MGAPTLAAGVLPHRPNLIDTLRTRERYRDEYWDAHDPIADDRLRWQAQTLRHLVHLLPSQTILELGCGQGRFTHQLSRVTRGENRITAVSFGPPAVGACVPYAVERVQASSLPGPLAGRQFDYVLAGPSLSMITETPTPRRLV